jgi:hypothetical protein
LRSYILLAPLVFLVHDAEVVMKAITETRVALPREIVWFPYRPKQYELLRRLAKTVFGTRFGGGGGRG